VKQLDERYPRWREERLPVSTTSTIGTPVRQLDVETVVKASQALSSEMFLPKLIEKLMRIAVEHAGAERGLLILLRGDEPQIEAEATTGHGRAKVSVRQAAITPSDLPQSALHYVIRTRERLVLDDASVRNLYSEDEYVRAKRARSVLCLPIVKQTKLIGALYLENNLTPRAFTSDRVAVLEMLASQAAISLENANLYSELQRSEAFLAQGQSISHTGSWAWNVATRQSVYWSQENYCLFGFDPEGGIPSDEAFYQRVHPEDRDRVRREVFLERPDEGSHFDVEFRIVLPGEAIKCVRSTGHPVRNLSGDLVEYVGTSIDVTERKRADEERERLRQVQADLAHLSRVTTMGELTASLAHEIKQPISAALTNAKTCLLWLGRDEPNVARACETASRLVKDVTRAADIIGRISSLFKKGPLQRELVDVNELIREMIVLLRSEANRYSISIRTELAEGLPKVMADRVQLQQVFMNLMLNGIEAMKEMTGGSELTIKSEADDVQLLISVSDTGVGLTQEQADQIFRAFFTTKDNGTGMGLPISRSIIESHGGRLWAAGNSARGATFQFTLPTTVAAHT
jgi:signal transduction histidine kinase